MNIFVYPDDNHDGRAVHIADISGPGFMFSTCRGGKYTIWFYAGTWLGLWPSPYVLAFADLCDLLTAT